MKFSQKTKDTFRFLFTFKKGMLFFIGAFLGLILFIYLAYKSLINTKFFLAYYVLGILVSLIILLALGLIVVNLLLKFNLVRAIKRKQKVKNPDIAIILGYDGFKIIGNLFISTYLGVNYLLKFLENKKYNLYITPSKKEFNKILKDNKIKIIYLIGHGSSRGFELNKKEGVSYSDYRDSKIIKDEIHLYHCGHGDGKTLIDYLVKKENREKCHKYNDKEMVISYTLKFYDLYKQQLKTKNTNQ
jgi:hypothetical protein